MVDFIEAKFNFSILGTKKARLEILNGPFIIDFNASY